MGFIDGLKNVVSRISSNYNSVKLYSGSIFKDFCSAISDGYSWGASRGYRKATSGECYWSFTRKAGRMHENSRTLEEILGISHSFSNYIPHILAGSMMISAAVALYCR